MQMAKIDTGPHEKFGEWAGYGPSSSTPAKHWRLLRVLFLRLYAVSVCPRSWARLTQVKDDSPGTSNFRPEKFSGCSRCGWRTAGSATLDVSFKRRAYAPESEGIEGDDWKNRQY